MAVKTHLSQIGCLWLKIYLKQRCIFISFGEIVTHVSSEVGVYWISGSSHFGEFQKKCLFAFALFMCPPAMPHHVGLRIPWCSWQQWGTIRAWRRRGGASLLVSNLELVPWKTGNCWRAAFWAPRCKQPPKGCFLYCENAPRGGQVDARCSRAHWEEVHDPQLDFNSSSRFTGHPFQLEKPFWKIRVAGVPAELL